MAWDIWRARYPMAAAGLAEFIPFETVLKAVNQPVISVTARAPDEIMAEMAQVVAAYEKVR